MPEYAYIPGGIAEWETRLLTDARITLDIETPPPPADSDVAALTNIARGSLVSYLDGSPCFNPDGTIAADSCSRCRRRHREAVEFLIEHPSGRDAYGFDIDGRDAEGYNRRGYDRSGFNRDGFNEYGYDRSGFNEDGYDIDGYASDGYNEDGERRSSYDYDDDDYSDRSDRSGLHYYSYTPPLKFRGEKPPWYGVELEVTSDYPRDIVNCVERYAGDLIYCKSDASVDGAELVTHPMSYDWAMEKFPWDMLPALRSETDASVVTQENGIHVHVSRDGFSNPTHMLRWMKLWYRNPSDIQRIARRRSDRWAGFNPGHRSAHVAHVKPYLPISRAKGYQAREALDDRYSAINTTNPATLEVRVFASSLRPQRVKAALQLVAGSVEYTRQLRADAITQRRGWSWQAFMAWTAKDGRYPDLIAENRVRGRRNSN